MILNVIIIFFVKNKKMEVKVEELRIGSFISWKSTNRIETVKDIKTSGLRRPLVNNVQITDVKPILITESWLLELGFMDIRYKGDPSCDFYLGDICIKDFKPTDHDNVKYIHELQDVIFVNTRE